MNTLKNLFQFATLHQAEQLNRLQNKSFHTLLIITFLLLLISLSNWLPQDDIQDNLFAMS